MSSIGSVFSFLTIIPSQNATLVETARHMHLFPLVGIAIGLLVGLLGFGLSFILDPLLVGVLVTASLAVLTGIHHADGLADFVDGLAAKGNRDRKLQAMKDLRTGSAGTVGITMYLVGLVATLSLAGGPDLFRAVLISEVLAKFSMVLMASLGHSAVLGSSSPFVDVMKDRRRLAVASLITLVVAVVTGGEVGLAMLTVAVILTVFLLVVSTRSFGGITGDVLGATNELTRLASLVVFVSV